MPEPEQDLVKSLMWDVVRKVFLGGLSAIAVVGLFLNNQIAAQGREILVLRTNQEYMAKRQEAQEADSRELRQLLRSLEDGNRSEHEILRNGVSGLNGKLELNAQANDKILTYLRELMVMKDQIIEKGLKP